MNVISASTLGRLTFTFIVVPRPVPFSDTRTEMYLTVARSHNHRSTISIYGFMHETLLPRPCNDYHKTKKLRAWVQGSLKPRRPSFFFACRTTGKKGPQSARDVIKGLVVPCGRAGFEARYKAPMVRKLTPAYL